MYVRTSIAPLKSALVGALCLTASTAWAAGPRQPGKALTADDMPELGEPIVAVTTSGPHGALQRLSVNAPIATLCADPRAKAVLDSDLPGLTTRPEYVFFKGMSLRRLQSMSRGRMSDADLAKVDAELAKLDVSYDAAEQ